jgi:hypothetical protein
MTNRERQARWRERERAYRDSLPAIDPIEAQRAATPTLEDLHGPTLEEMLAMMPPITPEQMCSMKLYPRGELHSRVDGVKEPGRGRNARLKLRLRFY